MALEMVNQTDARSMMFKPTLRRLVGRLPWLAQGLKAAYATFKRMKAKARRRRDLAVLIEEAISGSGDPGFVAHEDPVLSIIVSSDQGLSQTLSCLRSIATQAIKCRYEVSLYVPPGSILQDADRKVLERITGLRLAFDTARCPSADIANTRPGVEAILWLDARCILLKGAVNAMFESLGDGVIMTTPCIVSSDGWVIQGVIRAGKPSGVICVDQGSDWRNSSVNFRRTSDAGSGFCAMWIVGADVIIDQTDMVLRIGSDRQTDLASFILYQPDAKVVLSGPQLRVPAHVEQPEKTNGRSLLIVESEVPEIDRNAGARNVYEFARTLIAQGWTVKYWPMNSSAKPEYVSLLTGLGIEVPVGDVRPSFNSWLKKNARSFDHILICRPDVAKHYLPAIRNSTSVPLVYYGHDLHFARMEMQAKVLEDRKMLAAARKMQAIEESIWQTVDLSLYPTMEEVELLRKMHPKLHFEHVTIFCFDDFLYRDKVPPGEVILFVAGFRHNPNVDSAIWFANEIFPRVVAARPDARLVIIGSYPPQEVRDLAADNIEVKGWVSDAELTTAYLQARVSVVPLLFGAGLKLKTVEALTKGTPLVTTTVGAQGLDDLDRIATVADDPEAFAAGVVGVLQFSDDEWMERSRSQVVYSKARFGRERMLMSLLDAFDGAEKQRACPPK
jgi:glycosyltransferase involved in cell wall biosynthesis